MLHKILIKGFAIQGCSNQKKHESWTLGNHVVNIVKKTCRIMAFIHWETHGDPSENGWNKNYLKTALPIMNVDIVG